MIIQIFALQQNWPTLQRPQAKTGGGILQTRSVNLTWLNFILHRSWRVYGLQSR